jgi:hypothetical protein
MKSTVGEGRPSGRWRRCEPLANGRPRRRCRAVSDGELEAPVAVRTVVAEVASDQGAGVMRPDDNDGPFAAQPIIGQGCEAGEQLPEDLTKAQASERIDELRDRTDRR